MCVDKQYFGFLLCVLHIYLPRGASLAEGYSTTALHNVSRASYHCGLMVQVLHMLAFSPPVEVKRPVYYNYVYRT